MQVRDDNRLYPSRIDPEAGELHCGILEDWPSAPPSFGFVVTRIHDDNASSACEKPHEVIHWMWFRVISIEQETVAAGSGFPVRIAERVYFPDIAHSGPLSEKRRMR